VLVLIFVLLQANFRSVKTTLLVYANVPLAVTGGVFALALRGLPFSISAASGSSPCSASR
jgi:cobalt-zinc-cadmium resistance protein CzcA